MSSAGLEGIGGMESTMHVVLVTRPLLVVPICVWLYANIGAWLGFGCSS